MLGGRASDLLGRRRVFIVGIAVFGVSSLVCAAAQAQGLLLGARAVQGLGAAIISPASLAIIASTFDEGPERNRAMGMWSAMAGLGGSSGVLLGGALTQAFDWPAIFLINAPVAAAVVIAARGLIPADGEATLERNFDIAGAVTVTAGLTALVYGVVRTDALGWGAAGVLIPFAASAALLAAFVLIETRVAKAPIMPFTILRNRPLRAANLVILLLGAALFAMWFFVSLYLQQVLGHGALETGLDFLPMTLSIVVAATVAPRLVNRFGARATLTAGMLLATAGLGLLTDVTADGSYASLVLPGGLLAAIGLGTSMVPATIAAVQGVARSQSGLASGMINTSRLIGGAVGLAALTTLATSHANSEIASGTAPLVAQADGYQVAFAAGAGLCLLGALAAAVMLRPSRAEPLGEPVTESG
jgi:EmrB/QacA subfamily drug resistance transporter